jgi:Na+/H+ antiporter NhaD/arsenite permease-like protein
MCVCVLIVQFWHIVLGLFVVSGAMVDTNYPAKFWNVVAGDSPFRNAQSVILISIYTVIASQLVGNVAVILMAEDEIKDLDDNTQRFGWMVLSWVSTVAGNFTLAGSAANIIVAEKASRHKTAKTLIDSISHFRVMGLLTVFTITFGTVIIYAECKMLGYI